MIQVQLPCLHVMYAAGDCKEVVVNALLKNIALVKYLAHNVGMLGISNILVTVAAEQILKGKTVLLTVFKSLANTLNLNLMVAERSAATGERSVPRE